MSELHCATETGPAASAAADPARAAYLIELSAYRGARHVGDWDTAWGYLERGHIIAQPSFILHLSSHAEMLKFAFARRDVREISGQILRLALVPLGAFTGWLPVGNSGRARVSSFAPMPLPEDLKIYLRRDAS